MSNRQSPKLFVQYENSVQDKHSLLYLYHVHYPTPSRTLRSTSDTLRLQIPNTRLSTVAFRA